MPTVTSMLSRNCCERAGMDSTPQSRPARSPAKKFRPTRRTPASPTARTNASTAASVGTGSSNGHQNSTAPKPAARAAAGRCSRGRSVNSMEQFARYRSEWLILPLSVDGNCLSPCEYVRPWAGPPSTVPRRPPSTVPSDRRQPVSAPFGAGACSPLARAAQVVAVEIRAVQAGERVRLRFVQGAAVQPADQEPGQRLRRGGLVEHVALGLLGVGPEPRRGG